MDSNEFAKWRIAMGWSERQAARALEVDRRTVQEIERGGPVGANIKSLCLLLNAARRSVDVGEYTNDEEMNDLFIMARKLIVEAEGLPAPGRPKKDPTWLKALEALYEAVNRNRGTLILGAEQIDGTTSRRQIGEILTALEDATAARVHANRPR